MEKDDRIVFLGDSITQAGVKPQGYVTVLSEAIKAAHPDLGIETFGAGISGNKVPNLQARLEKDVIAKKPTLVFIYTGSQLVDLRKAFIDHLKANNPDNKPKGILTGDGVHLNPKGNAVVAAEMGKAIGVEVK